VRADLVWQVYERVSRGTALVPPALAFSLDREGRTETEVRDLERRSNGAVKFLPRRTFENYLLHPGAISAVLGSTPPETVADWLRQAREEGRYREGEIINANTSESQWHIMVNAPKVLKDLFWEFATLEYSKTAYSVALTRWLLGNAPGHLRGLLDYLLNLVAR
jgi:hypothetical protein